MQININTKTNSWRAWFLAARPRTLTGAAVPVMIGAAYACKSMPGTLQSAVESSLTPMLLCFLFAFLMQIDANFINDYFDCVKGRDTEERLGPPRACQQGWVTLKAMRWAIGITTVLACLAGLPLIMYGGLPLIGVGVFCVLFCFLYTMCLSGLGLGDLLVVIFFGLVPVFFTYYVMVPEGELRELSNCGLVGVVGLACGLVVDTLLIVNNYRDIEADRRSGKRTLVVLLGKKASEWLYIGVVPVALVMILCIFGTNNLNLLLTFVVYFLHVNAWSKMRRIGEGRALNKVLAMTARNILVFGIMTSLLIILA